MINDAKLTANTQLPSVRFDVNDADVSQQLGQRVGEEVSHFYHPTPPPPRNPNGFWERIEQRYKNNFERQALIAEGRAAANSEVMRESFRHAGANQQNYLDLGYSDRKAQTRAGLIAGAELSLPRAVKGMKASRFLAKGTMQASRLANRWGLFGRNLSKEPLNFYEARNHINALRLQRSFTLEQAKSIFKESGGLLPEVIQNSILIKPSEELGNLLLREELIKISGDITGWGKYSTSSTLGPSGDFKMHFYHNDITGDIYYGMDYKAIFNHQGSWSLIPSSNFEFEPPRFNL